MNPPSPKARLWTNDELPPDPDRWLAGATEHRDTWWNDWAQWIGRACRRAGRRRPPMGSERHPVLGDGAGHLRAELIRVRLIRRQS